ncbi:MAG: hypothetical protein J3T61_04655 [Candidatus Brocadiales bacterium]|nr:hypothetical protein [Candidatus Bathyanammoxibius sp.]
MLKINRDNQSLSLLDAPTLTDVSITERYDLQEFISNSPDAFFKEIGQALFLVGKEVEPSKNVQDRIDLLAVDKEGTCVVIELKRGNHKLQMLQAISYAGMISQWEPDDFLQLLDDDQQDALSDFLEVDREDINRQHRIILIAEAYDYALLIGAEWLSEQYGVDIICCRIALAKDSATNSEYLVCSNVYPAPELAKEAVSRGRKRPGTTTVKWPDWKSALSGVTNAAIVSYYEQELKTNRESNLSRRTLRYPVAGRRRWNMHARKKNAYVWQIGRFENDIEFWQHGLSKPDDVKPVKNGECLRLFLNTANDFVFFHDAATEKLQSSDWLGGAPEEELEEAEQD